MQKIIALMRAANDVSDAHSVLELFAAIQTDLNFSNNALPKPIFMFVSRAFANLGHYSEAIELIKKARYNIPSEHVTWGKHETQVKQIALKELRVAASVQDWSNALKIREKILSTWTEDPDIRIRVNNQLKDSLAVLNDEPVLMESLGILHPAELPTDLLMMVVSARTDLELISEALELLIEHQSRSGSSEKLQVREAHLRRRIGDDAGALSIFFKLWKAGNDQLLLNISAALIHSGELDTCAKFLDEAEADGRGIKNGSIALAWANYWDAKNESSCAIDKLNQSKDLLSSNTYLTALARFASRADREDIFDNLLNQADALVQDPSMRAENAQLVSSVVWEHWRCFNNEKRIESILSELEKIRVNPGTCALLVRIRIAQGRDSIAQKLIRQTLADFPSAVMLWAQLLTSLGVEGEKVECSVILEDLRKKMSNTTFFTMLSKCDPTVWDIRDFPDLITHALSRSNNRFTEVFLTKLRRVRVSAEDLKLIFEQVSKSGTSITKGRVELMRRRSADLNLLERTIFDPVSFESFLINRIEMKVSIKNVLDECCGDGVLASNPEMLNWLSSCVSAIKNIESSCPDSTIFSGESFSDAYKLAAELIRRIKYGIPTSALRIGDGEGHFLPQSQFAAFESSDQDFIQKIWWRESRPNPSAAVEIISAFAKALSRADIIGVIPPWRLLRDLSPQSSLTPGNRGILKGLLWAAESPIKKKSVQFTSAHFHQDLHYWGLWPEIFTSMKSVSWISCHNIASYLWFTHGVSSRQQIMIPPEKQFAERFGATDTSTLKNSVSLIDVHSEICRQLEPHPGEVYLVAAGFLGKIYCDLIRAKGGIGIDVGSVVDYWMGYSTRDYHPSSGPELSIGSAFISGMGDRISAPIGRILGGAGIARSTNSGRYNIGSLDEPQKSTEPKKALIRVVGHPRTGTSYMASLFRANGIEIGHEKLLRDGISSWSHVVSDLQVPFGDNASWDVEFLHTVINVRDPNDAIPSIILENGIGLSYDFRRQHILRATGVDLSTYTSPIDRAVASLLLWHEMALRLNPSAVFRVEDPQSVINWLATWTSKNTLVGNDQFGVVGINSTRKSPRFVLDKPNIQSSDWSNLNHDLGDRLTTFCKDYCYSLPW